MRAVVAGRYGGCVGLRAGGRGEVTCATPTRFAKPKRHAQSSWRRDDEQASRARASFTSSRSGSICDAWLVALLSGHALLGRPMVRSAAVVTMAAVAVAAAAAKVAGEGLSFSLSAAAAAASSAAVTACE